jgi:hypothetical protein
LSFRSWAGSRIDDCHIQALLFVMLEIAITLILGFALGYGVREWAFRQSHRASDKSDAGPSEKCTHV